MHLQAPLSRVEISPWPCQFSLIKIPDPGLTKLFKIIAKKDELFNR
jgi:hypothetical protein